MNFWNKTIMVTGCAGSIGSELCRQLYKKKPKRLLMLDQDETRLFEIAEDIPKATPILASIREICVIDDVFRKYKPDIVFHAAALKHVPLLESHPDEAWKTNVNGLTNVLDVAEKYKVKKLVFISTDKAVEPVSVMGKTKREGEEICRGCKMCCISVRFGNVLASRGSVIPIWRKQLRREQPIEITDKYMERYLMTIFEACDLVINAAIIGKGGDIFVLDMGKPEKIVDLAKQFIRLSGKNPKLKIIGKRAGEKMTEKLINNDEELVATSCKKILKVVKK